MKQEPSSSSRFLPCRVWHTGVNTLSANVTTAALQLHPWAWDNAAGGTSPSDNPRLELLLARPTERTLPPQTRCGARWCRGGAPNERWPLKACRECAPWAGQVSNSGPLWLRRRHG